MGILINLKVTVTAYAQNLASVLHITVDQFICFPMQNKLNRLMD